MTTEIARIEDTGTNLITVDAPLIKEGTRVNPVELFVNDGANDIIKEITEEVERFKHDLSTKEGRAETQRLFKKVNKTRSVFDGIGKDLVADVKANIKIWDTGRKKLKDSFTDIADIARAPLDAWETEEEKRTDALDKRLFEITNSPNSISLSSSEVVNEKLVYIREIPINDTWQDYEKRAKQAKEDAVDEIKKILSAVIEREEKDAELAQLRQDKADRDAKDLKDEQEREATEKAKEAAQPAIDEAKERTIRAEVKVETAVEDAQAQVNADALAEQTDALLRKQDTEHRARINREALSAICLASNGLTQSQGIAILTAIAKGKVPHVTVNY